MTRALTFQRGVLLGRTEAHLDQTCATADELDLAEVTRRAEVLRR